MKDDYADILGLPHHVSPTRRHMTMAERGAQFSPYAALTGFESCIRESGRRTLEPVELGEDALVQLDRRLTLLSRNLPQPVRILCFVPDDRKEGGAYELLEGTALRMDRDSQSMLLEGNREIFFEQILALELPGLAEQA